MLADPIAGLESVISAVGELDGCSLTDLARVHGALTKLEAAFARQARGCDLAGEFEIDGFPTARSWLVAATRMSGGAAARWMARARFGFASELTMRAWSDGAITSEHVDRIAQVRWEGPRRCGLRSLRTGAGRARA